MKRLLTFSILVILAACGGKKSGSTEPKNILENLTFSVDTVMIDSKGEIINLRYGLGSFGVFPNSNSLILLDQTRNIFQWIDLDKLELVEQTEYQKDGPYGLGNVFSLQTLPEETMLVATFNNSGIFNKEAKQLEQFNLKPNEIDGLNELNPFDILTKLRWDPSSRQLFSLPGNIETGIRKLAIIDPLSQEGKLLPLPKMDIARNFRVTFLEEGGGFEEIYDQLLVDGQLYISCSVSSGIYQYDTKLDSLKYFDFSHLIIPNEKKGEIRNDPSSAEEWWQEYKKVVSQISYWGLNWDENTSRFYRLASKSFLGETRQAPASYEVFLLVYDEELNLLGESKLNGLDQWLSNYFFKDGKLWSYVNVEDELGFAVFTFNF